MGATLFGELLNAVFANVGQRAVRTVARQTFEHLLNLDLKFHLSRQTGGLTRAIDRGTKCVFFFCPVFAGAWFDIATAMTRGVTFILQSILFRVVPTAFEISLVCGILVRITTLSTCGH
jgi:ATP-binding cassette, subfamily B (MDR/TAP), member 7